MKTVQWWLDNGLTGLCRCGGAYPFPDDLSARRQGLKGCRALSLLLSALVMARLRDHRFHAMEPVSDAMLIGSVDTG